MKKDINNKNKKKNKIKIEEGNNITKNKLKNYELNYNQNFENTSGTITDTEYEVTAETNLNNNDIIIPQKRS